MSNKPRKKKKHDPRRAGLKLQKGYGKGAQFGGMSYDVDDKGNMIIRCDSKRKGLKEDCALAYPRRWEIEIALFMEGQNGEEYIDKFPEQDGGYVFEEEKYLQDIVDCEIPHIYNQLIEKINPNHKGYWGWYAKAL